MFAAYGNGDGDAGFLIVDLKSNKVSASIWGTYTYNSTTGALGIDFTQTTFNEGQGPTLGIQATTITSMTDTHLIIKDQQGDSETWQRISGSLLPYGIHFPDRFLAISGNQIEYKISSLQSWQGQQVNAWLDQGRDTVCRDELSLPILVRK
jgi:hypothetical protein